MTNVSVRLSAFGWRFWWNFAVEFRLDFRDGWQAALDLHFQDAPAPVVGEGLADVEIPHGGVFDHLDEADEVPPRQW